MSHSRTACALAGVVIIASVFGASRVRAQDASGADEEGSLREYYLTVARDYSRMLSEAYGLPEADRVSLEAEFVALVPAEIRIQPEISRAARQTAANWEQAVAKHGEDWQPTKEQQEELDAPMNAVTSREPMTPENLRKLAEKRAPRERLATGPAKFEEIQIRESQLRGMPEQDRLSSETGGRFEAREGPIASRMPDTSASAVQSASLSVEPPAPPAPTPIPPAAPAPTMPAPSAAPAASPIITPPPGHAPPKPTPPAQQEPARTATPVERSIPVAPPPTLPSAPPIDEWERQVDSVAQKYSFTSDQKRKAQGILKDLRDRARQYRKSRSLDFDAARRMHPGSERTAEEGRLNQPLDELFTEFTDRLEQLATQAQREAVGTKKK